VAGKKKPKLSDLDPKPRRTPAPKPKLSDINKPAPRAKPGKGDNDGRRIDRPGF